MPKSSIGRAVNATSWRTAAAAPWLLTAIFCATLTIEALAMDDAERLLARMRSLPEAAYEHRDARSLDGLTTEALKLRFRGMLLSAPGTVDGGTDAGVPALLLMARSRARSAALPLQRNAIVVATDLDRGNTYVGPAFRSDPSKVPAFDATSGQAPQGPSPINPTRSAEEQAWLEELGDGDSANLIWLEFGKLLGLGSRPARYALRVIDFDEVSNPAFAQVENDTVAEAVIPPEAVASAVARLRATDSSRGLPSYKRTAQSPVLAGPGAALKLGMPVNRNGVREYAAHGSIKLEVSRQMIVGPSASGQQPTGEPSDRTPSALLRASVLVVMKGHARAMKTDVEIPVWTERTLRPGDVVEAFFSVDLAPVMPAAPPAGVYQVYLLAGPHLSGPHPLTLTDGG